MEYFCDFCKQKLISVDEGATWRCLNSRCPRQRPRTVEELEAENGNS